RHVAGGRGARPGPGRGPAFLARGGSERAGVRPPVSASHRLRDSAITTTCLRDTARVLQCRSEDAALVLDGDVLPLTRIGGVLGEYCRAQRWGHDGFATRSFPAAGPRVCGIRPAAAARSTGTGAKASKCSMWLRRV